MKKNFIFNCALLLSICNCSIVHAQTQVRSMTHDGITRSFRVHLPPAFDTCLHVPLVFNLHGLGSNGMQEELYTQFSNVADTGKFIAVYPDAISNEWNINGSGVDDVGFIQAMIDTLYAEFRIDRNKVYSCGMSMGGYMSYRLACELTDHIAAIVSVTGLLATVPCNPARPIPVMQIHGTDDPTVPYSGVPQTISSWVQKNNCPQTPVVTQLPDIDPNDSTTVTMTHYAPCDDSTEVILYTVNGGGHTWPDAFINIGVTTGDINASNIIWNFFKKYELAAYPLVTPCDSLTSGGNVVKNLSAFRVRYVSEMRQIRIESASNESYTITLFDALGRSAETFSGEKQTLIPFMLPSSGIYYYVIQSASGVMEKGKIAVY
ncbi:MAG: PHB depolymerase family esterase [Chitinophagales bacterium]|nr:PHB depolymerase family esterase [Chitinophagales bacterium]